MARPKKVYILLNVSSAVCDKWTKLNVRTCFYGNHELCIQKQSSKEKWVFSCFKGQTLFVVTSQIEVHHCAMRSFGNEFHSYVPAYWKVLAPKVVYLSFCNQSIFLKCQKISTVFLLTFTLLFLLNDFCEGWHHLCCQQLKQTVDKSKVCIGYVSPQGLFLWVKYWE